MKYMIKSVWGMDECEHVLRCGSVVWDANYIEGESSGTMVEINLVNINGVYHQCVMLTVYILMRIVPLRGKKKLVS